MLATRYTSLATSPISEDDFAGPDVRYTSEFEAIESALEKAGSIHSDEGPDWQAIVVQAEQILQSLSKDLRVACWLTWGLYRSEGLNGLQAGVAMLDTLMQHWDSLHPRKDRTRSAAFGWFANRLETAMPELLTADSTAPVFQHLHDGLHSLDRHLQGVLGEQAPLLQPLCRQLHNQIGKNSGTAPASSNTTSPVPPEVGPPDRLPDAPLATSTSQIVESISSPRDAHKTLRALQEQSRSLCQWWQAQSVVDPRAISLARTVLWLPIEALPEHDGQGKTGLRGLPADRLKSLQDRLHQGQPAELLREIENSLARSPFWLDGQYLAWHCLDELKAESARQEIEQHLGSFLKRLPGIEKLQFFDGTPFASQQTLGWISSNILPDNAGADSCSNAVAPALDEPWEAALAESCNLLHQDGLKAAMAPLKAGIDTARGGRAHLHWQLATARLCLQAGKHELARNILEGLEHTLRELQLASWEPQLLVRVMRLLLKSHELQGAGKTVRQRREEILQRLCHLDFEVVLEQALGP